MRLRATRANTENTLLNALIYLLRSIGPIVSYKKYTRSSMAYKIRRGFLNSVYTLQSCEECSEGNATRKKGRKEDSRLI